MAIEKITPKHKELFNQAIARIEEKTSGEIALAIIGRSDFYHSAHLRSGLVFMLFIPMAIYHLPLEIHDPAWYLWAQIPAFIFGHFLCFFHKVKLFFSLRKEMDEQVHRRAMELFLSKGVSETTHRNGILLMISLVEQRVEIIADTGIHKHVDKDHWREVIGEFVKDMRKEHDLSKAIIHSLELIGEDLIKYFPADKEHLKNQVSNEVTVLPN